MSLEAELIAAIEAAPEDPAPRLVYADWLEQRGDPRAELVQLSTRMWQAPIDLPRVRTLGLRREDLQKRCDRRWLARIQRPSFAEIRRRIGVLSALDPERKQPGAGTHDYRLRAPLTVAELAALEARIGGTLPEDYRRFLTELGDGGAGPEYGLSPIAAVASPALMVPFPAPTTQAEATALADPPGAFAICDLGYGHRYWLVTSGPEAGAMWKEGDGDFLPEPADGQWPRGDARLAVPRLGFVDWYVTWLDEELWDRALLTPDGDEVFARDPRELTYVTLSGRGLTAVPDGLRRLIHLRRLELDGNPLEALPDWLGELGELQQLSIGDHVRRLPDSIGALRKLTSLGIAGNRLATLPDTIAELSIAVLDASRNELTCVPPALGRMALHQLKLRRNRLTTLPDELAGLRALYALDLSDNPITRLPVCVGALPALQFITLDGLPALDLAAAFTVLARIPTLRSVRLARCQLRALPPEVGLLTQIEALVLSDNHLTTLPAEMARMTRLGTLSMHRNAVPRDEIRALLPNVRVPY